MDNLFSHATEPPEQTQQQTNQTTAIYISVELPLPELWLAFTEYTHLWWPQEYKRDAESYIEFEENLLLEETSDGEQYILGEVQHFAPEDVIALHATPHELAGRFTTGLSFVFDEEDSTTSSIEISSGIVLPRELADSPIGIVQEDKETAQTLLGGFARFMKAEITIE